MNTNMDMRIAGSGNIPAGEYNTVSVSGSGRLHGKVRCYSFSSSGSSHGDEIECSEKFRVSGSSSFSGDIKAKTISVSGALSCDGGLYAEEEISCSGSVKCKNGIKCEELKVSGAMRAKLDIEAERVRVRGTLNCEGLLNAEDIEIRYDRSMEIGSIGGSKIVIFSEGKDSFLKRLPLFSSLARSSSVSISGAVEGDEIALEGTEAPRVTGRVVAIGRGCHIDLVQYSEDVEISPDAKVLKCEKI